LTAELPRVTRKTRGQDRTGQTGNMFHSHEGQKREGKSVCERDSRIGEKGEKEEIERDRGIQRQMKMEEERSRVR
jgi:hypothetical protein